MSIFIWFVSGLSVLIVLAWLVTLQAEVDALRTELNNVRKRINGHHPPLDEGQFRPLN